MPRKAKSNPRMTIADKIPSNDVLSLRKKATKAQIAAGGIPIKEFLDTFVFTCNEPEKKKKIDTSLPFPCSKLTGRHTVRAGWEGYKTQGTVKEPADYPQCDLSRPETCACRNKFLTPF